MRARSDLRQKLQAGCEFGTTAASQYRKSGTPFFPSAWHPGYADELDHPICRYTSSSSDVLVVECRLSLDTWQRAPHSTVGNSIPYPDRAASTKQCQRNMMPGKAIFVSRSPLRRSPGSSSELLERAQRHLQHDRATGGWRPENEIAAALPDCEGVGCC